MPNTDPYCLTGLPEPSLTGRPVFGPLIRKALLSAAALAMIVCLPAEGMAQMDRSKTIILSRSGPVNTIDPLRADYAETNYIVSALYNTLVTYDTKGELVGSLATDFKVGPDAKSVNITLRTDVKFHDGSALTAKDVAFTLDRTKRLGTGVAGQISGYDHTEVHDDHSLTIWLTEPNALFIGALSKIYIVNSALVAANAGNDDGQAWLQKNDAGSGAFTYSGFENNAFVVQEFPGYWDFDSKRPETILFRRIDEAATSMAELRAGNVDLVWGLSAIDTEQVAKTDGIDSADVQAPIQADVVFNANSGPVADKRVRKAIALTYDYEGALKAIQGGKGVVANGPLPTTLACRPDLPKAHKDVAEAKRLLAEAGATNIDLTMKFQPVFEVQKREATLIQSDLSQVGVNLKLEPIAYPDYLASLSDPKTIPQMILLLDFAQFPDTGVFLIRSFHSKSIGSTNRSGYSNPEVDKLLDEAVVTPDPDRRCDIYKQVQTIIQDEGIYMDMYTLNRQVAYRPSQVTHIVGSPVVYPFAPADLRLAN